MKVSAPFAAAAGAAAGAAGWSVFVAESGPEGPGAARLPLAFEPLLFLQPRHLALARPAGPGLSFYLEDGARGQTVALLHVELDWGGRVSGVVKEVADNGSDTDRPRVARSPGQAPFGGVQAAPGLPSAALHQLFDQAEATLRQHRQTALHLRAHPFCYAPAGAAQLAEVLRRRGYPVVLAEQNYHLDLQHAYVPRLHPSERRRLSKCRRHGLHFEQEPPFLLPQAYAFIEACRQERGQALSLPLGRVQELFERYPQQHFLFSVRNPDGSWAALTVAIQVSREVLYNFYPASPLRFRALSPVVLLNEGLHSFGRASGLRVLDLGTSSLSTGPNASLLRFKRHLGGVAGLRLSWQKQL